MSKQDTETKNKNNSNPADRGRRKYFSDYPFQDIPKKNGKGTKSRRVYAGNYYSYVIPEDYKDSPDTFVNRIKGFYAVISIIAVALWALGSFLGAGSHTESTFYVVGPYIILVLPVVLILFTVVEFLFTKNRKYERVFADALSKKLRMKTVFTMIGSGFCAVTEAVYLVIKACEKQIEGGLISVAAANGQELVSIWYDIGYIALFIALGFLAYFFLKLQDSLKIEPV